MTRTLLAWIGTADLQGPTDDPQKGVGPIAQALFTGRFDRAVLLTDHPAEVHAPYLTWLFAKTGIPATPSRKPLRSPTHFGDIYEAARDTILATLASSNPQPKLTFHLSPGTPAMAAVWLILGKALPRNRVHRVLPPARRERRRGPLRPLGRLRPRPPA